MRASELRDLSDDELVARLGDTKEEYFNLRFQRGSGQLEDMSRIRTLRRDVARILTVMRERQLAASMVAAEENRE